MKPISRVIKLFLFCGVLLHANFGLAQQPPQYTQYMYNTSALNSGYTGSNGKLEATLLHRSQWVGLEGAPTVQSFTFEGKLKERIGIGLGIINDDIGAANNLKVNANFAYQIPVGYYTRLALGINAGLDILKVDWSKGTFENGLDPIFQENVNTTRPVLGAGAYLHGKKWYVGLSSNNFLNSQIYNDNDANVTDRKSQYYFMGGYVFDVSKNLKFKPTLLAKHVSGAPLTVDISGNFLVKEVLVLGVAYRYDDALSALAGFTISKKFYVGYAYDYSIAGLQSYNDGSHEIILKYTLFDNKKRALSPRFF